MLKVYTIYDNKAGIYNTPIVEVNEETVLANIEETSEKFNEFGVNAIDYDLFELGEYDTSDGCFELNEGPKHIANVQNLIKKDK